LLQSISGSQQAGGMFYQCPPQTGDNMTYQTETAPKRLYLHQLSWYGKAKFLLNRNTQCVKRDQQSVMNTEAWVLLITDY